MVIVDKIQGFILLYIMNMWRLCHEVENTNVEHTCKFLLFGAAPGVRQCESGGRKDSLWRCGCLVPGCSLLGSLHVQVTTFTAFMNTCSSMNNRLNLRKPIIECALELELELELEHPWHTFKFMFKLPVVITEIRRRSIQKQEMCPQEGGRTVP